MAKTPTKKTPLTVENFPDAFNMLTGTFHNGSAIPSEKPILQGLTDMSRNVYYQGVELKEIKTELRANTQKTNENSELLQSKKQRKVAVTNLISLIKSLNLWTRLLILGFVLHYGYIVIDSIGWKKAFDFISDKLF